MTLDRRAVPRSAYGKLSDRFLKLASTVLTFPHALLALTVDASQAKTIGISVLQLPCVERELLFRFRLEALRALLPIAVIARAGRGFFRQLPLVCRKKKALGFSSTTLGACLSHAPEALAVVVRLVPFASREGLPKKAWSLAGAAGATSAASNACHACSVCHAAMAPHIMGESYSGLFQAARNTLLAELYCHRHARLAFRSPKGVV